MDFEEDRFLAQNKYIEDKLDELFHAIELRLDKLYNKLPTANSSCQPNAPPSSSKSQPQASNPCSSHKFATFKAPYIRDFRNFSAPLSEDTRQIQQLTGTECNIDQLIQTKHWTKEAKHQLEEAVLEHYAKLHIIKLIKQKNQLLESSKQNDEDEGQKLRLIDEQLEQVRARKMPRFFVPEDRYDTQIDWCAISAKVSSHHDARDCRLMWSNQLHWSINSDPQWTKDEDICLINAVAKRGKNSWERVAHELNSGRLAWQCCARYNQHCAMVQGVMDQEDAEKTTEVINLCRIGNYVPWDQVMYFIQYHSLHQVKWQWQKYCSEQRDTSNWTRHEDYILLRAVKKFGEREWSRIAQQLPGRTNKSCRERYIMRLRFLKRALGSWRRPEDLKLMSLVENFGTNWSLIAAHMPERNCHQLRNRYELLKNEIIRPCPLKHRRLVRQLDGQFLNTNSIKKKLTSEELETNRRLREIFSTYMSVNKNSSKSSLTCRSAQDEVIYQSLVRVLCDKFLDRKNESPTLLEKIIQKSSRTNSGLMAPCIPTLRAYKAWSLQQHYLKQFDTADDGAENEATIDQGVLRVIVSIFLWPAILARLRPPQVNVKEHLVGSLIERNAKNLYRIRDIQRQITK